MNALEHVEPLPIDDADYGKEFHVLSDDALSTCQKCGAGYDAKQFMALAPPDDGQSVWRYESSNVSIAVRKCGTAGCGNMLGRRIA